MKHKPHTNFKGNNSVKKQFKSIPKQIILVRQN